MTDKYDNYQLCYIDDLDGVGTIELWFSREPVETIWGDDWNDRPYEHNAGEPYKYTKDNIENDYVKIIVNIPITAELLLPCTGTYNSNFSVEDINIRKQIPWLRNDSTSIYAGHKLKDVLLLLKEDCNIFYDSKFIGE